ncbi:MAG: hypothetical protein ACI3ZL_08545 [Candidatus Cryptobacteroides sp.]
METVIGIICIVLILVFKLIERTLQKSSDKGKSRKTFPGTHVPESLEEVFPVWSENAFEADKADSPEVKNVQVEDAPVSGLPVFREVAKPTKPKATKMIFPSADSEKKPEKQKIDPKKLVIYSEIMKPKY